MHKFEMSGMINNNTTENGYIHTCTLHKCICFQTLCTCAGSTVDRLENINMPLHNHAKVI